MRMETVAAVLAVLCVLLVVLVYHLGVALGSLQESGACRAARAAAARPWARLAAPPPAAP